MLRRKKYTAARAEEPRSNAATAARRGITFMVAEGMEKFPTKVISSS